MARGHLRARGAGVGDRQPRQGRRWTGGAKPERHARHRRTDGAAVTLRPLVIKFGGELLEDPERLAALVEAVATAAHPAAPPFRGHRGREENDPGPAAA